MFLRGEGSIWLEGEQKRSGLWAPRREAIASDRSNFQREPGQATVSVSFPSSARGSPAIQEMQKTNGGLGGR